MDFITLEEHLNLRKTPSNASEFHGQLTGWFAAGSKWTTTEVSGVLVRWIGDEPISEPLSGLVSTLALETLAALQDLEFGFALLLPDDNALINFRSQALSRWCSGFLSGFGMSGRFQQEDLAPEVTEIISDFAQIANLGEDVPDAEENEEDLMEVSEYVRMSTLLVYSECANRSVH